MRILLTSSGIRNASIHDALVELLGKPIAESSALCIPTGVQPFPGGPSHVYGFINGSIGGPMCGLGWKSLGVLELTALPSIKKEYWVPAVQEVDALLVWGGSPLYLVTGCGSPGSPTSCRHCGPTWSTSARVAVRWSRLPTSEERPTTTVIHSQAATERWGLLVSPCFHTSIVRMTFRLPLWPRSKPGPRGCQFLRTRLTIRPPSRWLTAPSRSSPRGTGNCIPSPEAS